MLLPLPVLLLMQMPTLGAMFAKHSADLGGRQLVGLCVWMDWGEDNVNPDTQHAWYKGQITHYEPHTGEFEVRCCCCCCCYPSVLASGCVPDAAAIRPLQGGRRGCNTMGSSCLMMEQVGGEPFS